MVVIGDSQWESLHTLSETLPHMAEHGILNDLPPKEHEGVIMCFCAVLINICISPPREYEKLVKIKSPVIFLMQINLFVLMQNLWINFMFTHNPSGF